LKSLGTYGICRESTWPYVISKFSSAPSAVATKEAANFKALTYALVDQPGMTGSAVLTEIKKQLANGIPMEFGFDVFDSYGQASKTGAFPYPSSNENCVGGHAIMVVGYDDSKVITNTINKKSTKGAFLIRNSWGTSWGEKGYGWLPYDYVTVNFQGTRLATDFWILLSEAWTQIKTSKEGDNSKMVRKFDLPSLVDLATFIDSVKNVIFALIFVGAGFYVTLHTELPVDLVNRWVDMAMIVGSIYVGTRAVGSRIIKKP
jgi:hypothetical protein